MSFYQVVQPGLLSSTSRKRKKEDKGKNASVIVFYCPQPIVWTQGHRVHWFQCGSNLAILRQLTGVYDTQTRWHTDTHRLIIFSFKPVLEISPPQIILLHSCFFLQTDFHFHSDAFYATRKRIYISYRCAC